MVVMVTVLLTLPVILDSILSIQEVTNEVNDLDESIKKTITDLENLVVSNNDPEIQFDLTLVFGGQKLWNFEKFDLIINFDGRDDGRKLEKQTFAGNCSGLPSQGEWCIDSFNNDIMDPNILNEGESITIRTQVSDELVSNGIVIIALSTDLGVVASISTTV